MKVLFDGYWWVGGPPSGRNVLHSLVRAWRRAYPADVVTVRVPRADQGQVIRDLADPEVRVETYPRVVRIQAAAAVTTVGSAKFDAVVTQNFSSLSGSSIRAVLVHDAMFVDHPEWFTWVERRYFALMRPTLRRADIVFTTSVAETERVRRCWPEVADLCRPIGLGVPEGIQSALPRRPRLGLPPDAPFVLSVGRLNVRKNIARLIAAFETVARVEPDHRLVVVGTPDGALEDLKISPEVKDRVQFSGYVDDAELRWLYQNARLFVVPSLDEGFGLPVLEAAHEGLVIAASDIPVFRELGLVDHFFDPRSIDSMATAIEAGLRSGGRQLRHVPYTWERTVGAMRTAFTRVLEGQGTAHA